MQWEFRNDIPIYTQLILQIKLGIVTGVFPAGQRLPSVRELAAQAGVNPNTMQRAFTELERENLVFSQRTAGRFVTEDEKMIEQVKSQLAQTHIQTFFNEMRRLGYNKQEMISLLEQTETEGILCQS